MFPVKVYPGMASRAGMKKLFDQWRSDVIQMKSELVKNLTPDASVNLSNAQYVGGLDISFKKDNPDERSNADKVHACVCLVVVELESLEIVYQHCSMVHMEHPYISGFLGFREAPFYLQELKRMKEQAPNLYPQVLLVDGNGILHNEGFGSACHIGVSLDIPTIGVAKQLLHADGLEKNDKHSKKISEDLVNAGDSFELVGQTEGVIGRALKSTEKSKKPIYVSIGHKINLLNAVEIVARCCIYRIPEPIRQADFISRRDIENNYQTHLRRCEMNWREMTGRLLQMEEAADKLKQDEKK